MGSSGTVVPGQSFVQTLKHSEGGVCLVMCELVFAVLFGFNRALEMFFTTKCLICLIYPSSCLDSLP